MIMSSMVLHLSQLLWLMTMMFIHGSTAFTAVNTEAGDDDMNSKVIAAGMTEV